MKSAVATAASSAGSGTPVSLGWPTLRCLKTSLLGRGLAGALLSGSLLAGAACP